MEPWEIYAGNKEERNITADIKFFLQYTNATPKSGAVLIGLLKHYFPELPRDPRTLLCTPKACSEVNIGSGVYVHLGLVDGLRKQLQMGPIDVQNEVAVSLNIDGLRVFNNSRTQLWPILGMLCEPRSLAPFVVGIFCGQSKPSDVKCYLQQLIMELQEIMTSGIVVLGRHLRVKLQCVICDTPARCFIRQVKSHSGYYGCDKCTQRGNSVNRRMTFPLLSSPLRNDANFRSQRQRSHHIGVSPFVGCPLDMIKTFPLDYMHSVCLGVCKKLVLLWTKGKISKKQRISMLHRSLINEEIRLCAKQMPVDFARPCRPLTDAENWKATECRQFLLYIGPIVLKRYIDPSIYYNFLDLSRSIYILSHPILCTKYVSFVKGIIRRFICTFSQLYGAEEIVYNVHSLIHLQDDVLMHGPLQNFSAFPFESYMRFLKRCVHGSRKLAQQIFRRIFERWDLQVCGSDATVDDTGVVRTRRTPRLRNAMRFHDSLISDEPPNDIVIIGGLPAKVVSVGPDGIAYRAFEHMTDYNNVPLQSGELYIFIVRNLSNFVQFASVNDVICKCVLFKISGEAVTIPILHTF